MNSITGSYSGDKKEMYQLLSKQLRVITQGEPHVIPTLANASALLQGALSDVNWVGFYLMDNEDLLVGPFQGKVACIRIPIGSGVCGTAVAENRTVLVKDVHEFSGHIACDSASNSEIVVPIRHMGQVVGVLDVDSPLQGRFDQNDQWGLELFVSVLEEVCNWKGYQVCP